MRKAIITTTINLPVLLRQYAQDSEQHGHEDLFFVVTGDLKSPHADIQKLFAELQGEFSYEFIYMDVEDQESFMEQFPELAAQIPWNCVMRRNISILKALEMGAEMIVTIDDDNFVEIPNYLDGHKQVGQTVEIDTVSSATGWFNICQFLEEKNNREFFVRGYPLGRRSGGSVAKPAIARQTRRVVVNGGFWLGDPDIDAVTRLSAPIDAIRYTREDNFCLDHGTYCPFNSQNTALARDVIPAYFLSPFVGRFDDIWASYMVKRIADHLGDAISFGYPIVRQDRNDHDLWIDADLERMGIRLTDTFCDEWLRTADVNGSNYSEGIVSLLASLERSIQNRDKLPNQYRQNLLLFIQGYREWHKACAEFVA